MTARDIERKLRKASSKERAKASAWFFKTKPGQYGAGDVFIGIPVPDIRNIVKEYVQLPLPEVSILLASPIHEFRLAALLLLVAKFKRGDAKVQKQIYHFYLTHKKYVNNWDLVDTSARDIVGAYLYTEDRARLFALAASKNLWDRRIAIVATHYFIQKEDFKDFIIIAEMLVHDSHDLIQKAVGWMLREAGKRNKLVLTMFLDKYAHSMPRTMLRYAIEHMKEGERKRYLRMRENRPASKKS